MWGGAGRLHVVQKGKLAGILPGGRCRWTGGCVHLAAARRRPACFACGAATNTPSPSPCAAAMPPRLQGPPPTLFAAPRPRSSACWRSSPRSRCAGRRPPPGATRSSSGGAAAAGPRGACCAVLQRTGASPHPLVVRGERDWNPLGLCLHPGGMRQGGAEPGAKPPRRPCSLCSSSAVRNTPAGSALPLAAAAATAAVADSFIDEITPPPVRLPARLAAALAWPCPPLARPSARSLCCVALPAAAQSAAQVSPGWGGPPVAGTPLLGSPPASPVHAPPTPALTSLPAACSAPYCLPTADWAGAKERGTAAMPAGHLVWMAWRRKLPLSPLRRQWRPPWPPRPAPPLATPTVPALPATPCALESAVTGSRSEHTGSESKGGQRGI